MDGRLHNRQQIPASMFGFPGESGDLLLAPLLLGNISRDFRRSNDFAFGILDRGNRQRDYNQTPMLAPPDRFKMFDTLSAPYPVQNRAFFGKTIFPE